MKHLSYFLSIASLSLALAFGCSDDSKDSGPSDDAGAAAAPADATSGEERDASGDPDEAPDASEGSGDAGGGHGSGGSGGLTCAQTKAFTTSGGQQMSYCVTAVAGSELKIVEPSHEVNGPLTLAIYLHGDGARPHLNGSAFKYQGDWVAARDVLYVSALAPNGCSWWRAPSPKIEDCNDEPSYEANPQDTEGKNADTLRAVIEAIRAAYDIDDRQILFAGSSGGAIVLTASWIPRHGDAFPGFYALACGGEKPWQDITWDTTDQAILDGIGLSFAYGTGERLAPDIRAAHDYYAELGIRSALLEQEPKSSDSDHCNYDQLGTIPKQWEEALAAGD